jgi:hypothetical protein
LTTGDPLDACGSIAILCPSRSELKRLAMRTRQWLKPLAGWSGLESTAGAAFRLGAVRGHVAAMVAIRTRLGIARHTPASVFSAG